MRDYKGMSLLDFTDSYVVFDLETTGLDPLYDEIIEIGAYKVSNNNIVDSFDSLIKPSEEIDEFITKLTGITNDMVADAPTIDFVLPDFRSFIGDSILIGHNVNFDINFVYDNSEQLSLDHLNNDFIDTMRLSRRINKSLDHHRLKDLAKFYDLDFKRGHRSLKDCEITKRIYEELYKETISQFGSVEDFKESCKKKKQYNPNGYILRAKDIIADESKFDEDNPIYDKNVCITGTLEKMIRKDAFQIIADVGGHCQDTVTKKTDYLVLGNNDYNPILRGKKSSKQLKAEELILKGGELEIISENVFYDLIEPFIEKNNVEFDGNISRGNLKRL